MNINKFSKIKVGGKEYPSRITMGAMVRFKNESGKDVSELKQTDISDLVLFFYCCVKSACNADKIPFTMDFDLFADSLEPESVNAFYEELSSSQKKTQHPVTNQ